MNEILLVLGLVLILGGANYLTDGAAAIAKRLRISEFVVGMTIVAIGTSMPEMVVSVISAMKGNGDLAVGNVVGSNIFNTFAILGLCALIKPMMLTNDNIKKDIPMAIIASLILIGVSYSGTIHRSHGVIMLLIYFALMLYSIKSSNKNIDTYKESTSSDTIMSPLLAVLLIIGGLGALIGGGQLFLNSAVSIAESLNIPQNVIAITLVAGGTSLPEMAASLVSLLKGKNDIALGNVLGSNIANIFLVLGLSSSITPLAMNGITIVDMMVALAGVVMLMIAPFTFKKRYLGRIESLLLLCSFVAYMYYVIS